MRTLKKTLCLVLCLAMVAGLCAVSAFAAFKDEAEITYKEAVEVLAGVGVINGMDKDTFAPKGTLTRAQACKIVAYLLGDEDVKAECTFDDCQGHWAADYIAYCAGKGIVNGVGDNKFAPDATLTGAAWAKMVLVALGYNADYEKMTGASWELGVGTLVKKLELTKGIAGFDGTKAISREEACQIAFNALTKEMVAYDNGGITIKTSDVEITTAAGAAKGTGNYLCEGLKIGTADKLNKVYATDDNGYEYYEYYLTTDTENKTPVTGKFYTEKVLGEYAADATAKAICKDLGITAKNVKDAKVTLVVNGAEKGVYAMKDFVADDATKVPANASLVMIKDGKTDYKAIVTVEYLKAAKLGAKVIKKTDDNYGKYEWTFDGYPKAVVYAEKDAYTNKALYLVVPENDNTAAEKFLSITEPEVVTGTVASKGTGYVMVDGEKLSLNAGLAAPVKDGKTDFTNEYDFYKFTSGVVGAIELHKENLEDVALNNVYVIAKAAKAAGASKTDLFDTTAGSAAAAQAKIIDLTTGEIKIVDQGIVVKDGKSYYADKNGKASANEVADLAAKDGAVNAIWKVAVLEDGSYVLVEAAEVKDVKTAKKAADFGVSGVVANSATVLTKVELTKDTKGAIKSASVSSVTGIANFPDMKDAVKAIVVANKAGVATSILYVAEYKAPETKTYAIYTGAGEETPDGQKLAFFQDGAAVEYYGTALDKDALYDITVADGKVTKADKVTAAAADKTVTVADDTFFKADSTLYFADKCTVVEKTESGYVEGELAVDDIVTYYTNTAGKVFFIVITGEVE